MAYTDRMMFEQFRRKHPELWRRGITYGISSWMTIEMLIPDVGRIRYNAETDHIEWLEYWVDQRKAKQQEKEIRPEMYSRFSSIVTRYMRNNNMTQQEFADYVGISRQSLSKYLLGDSIPKIKTMRRICDRINMDI